MSDPKPPDRPPEPPKPPFDPLETRGLRHGEVLGLGFRGEGAENSISLPLAGAAFAALDGLVTVMAAAAYGNLGARGPIVTPANLETLDIVDAKFGSAAFFFKPRHIENLALQVEAPDENRIGRIVSDVVQLVGASKHGDIFEQLRHTHSRVSARYVDLLEAVSVTRAATSWMNTERTIELSYDEALNAIAVLESTEGASTESRPFTGVLYEANARSRGFRLERSDEEGTISGRFDEDIIGQVAEHWNEEVDATVNVTTETLRRTGEVRRRFTLVALGPHREAD